MNAGEYMTQALKLAKEAGQDSEVPVGAVIVRNGEIISTGRNRRESGKNALYHAEIEAINSACEKLGGWRLWDCELYVTLEPCPMCAGAIINARIPKVYFGAYDAHNGCCGSVMNVFEMRNNFRPEYHGGIMEEECEKLIKDFFRSLRKNT